MKIWLNDQICDSQVIDLDSDGWPVGNGVFETKKKAKMIYERYQKIPWVTKL